MSTFTPAEIRAQRLFQNLVDEDVERIYRETSPDVWVTADRRLIPIKDMNDYHIVNVLRMEARGEFSPAFSERLERVNAEAAKRGISPTFLK